MWHMVIFWGGDVRVLMMHLGKVITAWLKDAFTSHNHVNHAPMLSGVSIYVAPLVPSGVCLHLSSADESGHGSQSWIYIKKKPWLHFGCDPPSPFPNCTQGPGVASHGKKMFRRQPEQHMVQWGNAGWRTIRLDALHLSLWIQTLSQFYSQHETFYSPSFE